MPRRTAKNNIWTMYSCFSNQAGAVVGDYKYYNNLKNPVTTSYDENGTQTDPHDFLLPEEPLIETSAGPDPDPEAKPLSSEDENNNNLADLNNNNVNSSVTGMQVGGNMTVGGDINTTISSMVPIAILQNESTLLAEPESDPIPEPIKVFPSIELPTPNFCGRQLHLETIHKRLQTASAESSWNKRVVLLYGLGGIGKTELARKYAQVYIKDEIIQNVAWIDAETLDSLSTSFLTLAQKLKLPTAPVGDTPEPKPEQNARRVYEHFSDHVGTGLFIFDNAQQMHDGKNTFGIYKYLPTQVLPRLPLVLITSRHKEWDLPKEAVILVDELDDEAAVELLSKRLNLTESQKNSEKDMKAVRKLAGALQGFPLALTLSPSNIHNAEYTSLPKEIDTYLKRMDAPDGSWALDKQSSGVATQYDLIMGNVWRVTLDRMEASGRVGKAALQLIFIMGYLPPDTITLQTVKNVFQFIFNEPATNPSFLMLEKYSLITIIKLGQGQGQGQGQGRGQDENNKSQRSSPQIRIHRLVQRVTRGTLDRATESKYSYILGICEYLSSQQANNPHCTENLNEYRITMHRHLKDRHWLEQENPIQYSYIFLSQVIVLNDLSSAWEILEDLYYGFHQTQSSGSGLTSRSMSMLAAVAEEIPRPGGSFADETNKLSLLHLALFYFNKQEKYVSNELFHNYTAHSKDILAQTFLFSAKLYILHLHLLAQVKEDTNTSRSAELESHSRLHKSATQLCGELLRIGSTVFDQDFKTAVGKMILSTIKSKSKESCQLENVEEIFSLMWSYSCHDPSLISPYVGTVCRKHFDIYTDLSPNPNQSDSKNSELSMSKYWASAGPFKYSNILNYVTWQPEGEIELGDLWAKETQQLFVDTFLSEGAPIVLAQHLQFLSTENEVGTKAQYPLLFISVLAFQWDCALNFIQAPNFMDALYNLTKKSLSISRSDSIQTKFCCLMTWFALFAKKGEVADHNQVLWSIHRIDNKLLNTFLEEIRHGGSVWWNIRYDGILESIVKSCKNPLAVEIAQVLIEIPYFVKAEEISGENMDEPTDTGTDGDEETC